MAQVLIYNFFDLRLLITFLFFAEKTGENSSKLFGLKNKIVAYPPL